MKRIILVSTLGLCVLAMAIGISMYGYPLSVYGQKTDGAIFTNGEAAYRARLSAGRSARIGEVKLTTRESLLETLFDYTGSYPPPGEFAAADSPVWVVVVDGDMRNILPFFEHTDNDGVIMTFDAATGLPGSFGGFTRGRDEEILDDFSKLENLDGQIEITPTDIRSLVPSDEEVEADR